MTPGRRTLRFETIDDIMPEVDRLIGRNTTVGHWSLGQILHHVAATMRRVVDLPASTPHDPALELGEAVKRQVFESGLIPEGLPAPPGVVPDEPRDEHEGAEALRAAIAHYKASGGPVIPHRLFGPLTKAEWDRLQCIHCAHHLSFVVPKPE